MVPPRRAGAPGVRQPPPRPGCFAGGHAVRRRLRRRQRARALVLGGGPLAFSEAKKKRLLFFVTGSDRVPIKGLAHLNPPFVVSRAGAHSDRLPSAHTCFNHLLLPDYSSKEYLQNRLELAVENAEGFGLC
ncbi:MAG: hypothetical protein WDW38_003640 [Sanguina aurantia]